MPDLVTVVPFALVGMAMVVFGLVLNRQGTLSARRLDAMSGGRRDTKLEPLIVGTPAKPSGTAARATVGTHS